MRPLRVAVVGLGVIARYYLEAIDASDELELVAACDRDRARLAGMPAGVTVTGDAGEVVALDEVEAVVVTLPNDLHAPVCVQALRAGKHVCCEKPLATSAAAAAELARLADERERTLMTAFHRRYNANLAAVEPQLRSSRIRRAGAIYHEDIHEHVGDDAWYLDPARCGGGCIADNGPNALDALRHVLGPLEVRAARIVRDEAGIDVLARIELTAPRDVEAVVELSWDYPHGEQKTLSFELDGGRRIDVDLLAGYPAFKSSLSHEYRGVLADFAARVRGERRVGVAGSDVAWLVERAYRIGETVALA
jgi:L-arabinose 1- dehydrogenase